MQNNTSVLITRLRGYKNDSKGDKTKFVFALQNLMEQEFDRLFNNLEYTTFIVGIMIIKTYFNWMNLDEEKPPSVTTICKLGNPAGKVGEALWHYRAWTSMFVMPTQWVGRRSVSELELAEAE